MTFHDYLGCRPWSRIRTKAIHSDQAAFTQLPIKNEMPNMPRSAFGGSIRGSHSPRKIRDEIGCDPPNQWLRRLWHRRLNRDPINYASGDYRVDGDGDDGIDGFAQIQDWEQASLLEAIESVRFMMRVDRCSMPARTLPHGAMSELTLLPTISQQR